MGGDQGRDFGAAERSGPLTASAPRRAAAARVLVEDFQRLAAIGENFGMSKIFLSE